MPEVKPIPWAYRTITPSLIVDDGVRALDFYERAFGAVETIRMLTPDGNSVTGKCGSGEFYARMSQQVA
jgi:PhnB protein